jgi:hypothetical protein
MIATRNNNIDSVKKEITVDKNKINEPDDEGNTPLMIACENGNLNMVKYLVENGANVDLQRKYSQNLYKYGYRKNPSNMIIVTVILCGLPLFESFAFVELGDYYPGVMIAYKKGNMDIVKYLISKGADCNQTVHRELSARALKFVEDGVGGYVKNPKISLLDIALMDDKNYNLAKVIIEDGLKDNITIVTNKKLWTHSTSPNSFDDLVKGLVLAGMDINRKDKKGLTILDQCYVWGWNTLQDNSAYVTLQQLGAKGPSAIAISMKIENERLRKENDQRVQQAQEARSDFLNSYEVKQACYMAKLWSGFPSATINNVTLQKDYGSQFQHYLVVWSYNGLSHSTDVYYYPGYHTWKCGTYEVRD